MTPDAFEAMVVALLVDLDRIARDVDHYEYGLPIHSSGDGLTALKERVAVALRAARDAATERAAKLAEIFHDDDPFLSDAARHGNLVVRGIAIRIRGDLLTSSSPSHSPSPVRPAAPLC